MKKFLSIVLTLAILACCAVFATSCSESPSEVNVYCWGDYFAEGSDGYRDTIAEFEEETGITVNLTTYETNEQLYEILSASNSAYDVIFPSDYMVEKLIDEDLVQKLDYSKIPNSENSLKGKILQFDNSRDAYAIAMQLCGIDPSDFTKSDVDKATKKLEQQKPLLKKFVMDQVFNEMEKNQSAIAPYYAGDIYNMTTNNEDLVGVLPKEGANLFVDLMCIPKASENVDNAHKFIDFMTRADVSAANSEYDTYASPVEGAKELIEDKALTKSQLVYPPDEYLDKCYTFRNVDDETYNYLREKFLELKS